MATDTTSTVHSLGPGGSQSRRALLDVALGNAPADTYIDGGRLVNVHTREIYEAGIAIRGARIAAVGDVAYTVGPETTTINAGERFLVPGLVDTHIHCFHSYLGVDEYVRLLLSHGVTAIADDFYGLGVVGGADAVRFFKEAFEASLIRLIFLVPTLAYLQNRYIGLTPAPGLTVEDMTEMLSWDGCCGLSETPFAAVTEEYPELLDLIEAALTAGKVVTGHAPDIGSRDLQAYVAMGAYTDHESDEHHDAIAKARCGMKLLSRQGSIGQNVPELMRMFTEHGLPTRVSAFSTDVASPDKLAASGSIDEHIRLAIAAGIDPIEAVQMATINGAEVFGLQHDIGSIAPGRYADIVFVTDLTDFAVDSVILGGQVVVADGTFTAEPPAVEYPREFYDTVKLPGKLSVEDLLVCVAGDETVQVRVLGVQEGTVVTAETTASLVPVDGALRADTASDVLHLAMVDRHGKGTGIGLGFVHGFGLKAGAIASSVSSECCNVCAVGADAESMAVAVNHLAEIGGGFVVAVDGAVRATVELPILGTLSEDSLMTAMRKFERLFTAIRDLGCELASPLSQLEFCFAGGLDPELKLSDEGLLRVGRDGAVRLGVLVDEG